jgi:hypothetical protein
MTQSQIQAGLAGHCDLEVIVCNAGGTKDQASTISAGLYCTYYLYVYGSPETLLSFEVNVWFSGIYI